MGDNTKDAQAAKQLIKDKGLHRETTTARMIFRHARSFVSTAEYLHERDLSAVPRVGSGAIPFVVNAAFSIELYLKSLADSHNKSLRGHELLKLYDQLPSPAVDSIKIAALPLIAKHNLPSNTDFRDCLSKLNNVYAEWRYCYESGNAPEIEIYPTIFVVQALDRACLSTLGA